MQKSITTIMLILTIYVSYQINLKPYKENQNIETTVNKRHKVKNLQTFHQSQHQRKPFESLPSNPPSASLPAINSEKNL